MVPRRRLDNEHELPWRRGGELGRLAFHFLNWVDSNILGESVR